MDLRDQLRQAQEQAAQLRLLVESPGWKWFENVLKAQVENRLTDIILTEPDGMDALVRKNYAIGEAAGIRTILSIPEMRLAELKEAIEEFLKDLGETENGNQPDNEPDDYPIG